MTTSTVEAEWVDSEHYLGPRMKRITFQCGKCNHQWVRTLKVEPKRDPPCPNRRCEETAEREELKREVENLRQILAEQRAPATVGANIRVKAIDETARIVMADGRYTDLRDNLREGDTMAPKLPPVLQRQADGFFNGAGLASVVGAGPGGAGRRMANRLTRMGQSALAGKYASTAVSIADIDRRQPGDAALRMVGTEKLRRD